MEINGKEVPFTATHYSFESGEFLRVSGGKYAQCLVDDRYWVECSKLTNNDLINNDRAAIMTLFKTGLGRDLANIRLFFLGVSYRIG